MIRKNDFSTSSCENEVNALREYVEKQINENWDKRNILRNGESRAIASFMTHAATWHGYKVYSKTAADIIVKELKAAGYFVWFSNTAMDDEDYWVTARPECPHPWFYRI